MSKTSPSSAVPTRSRCIRRWLKWGILSAFFAACGLFLFVVVCNWWVVSSTDSVIYREIGAIPEQRVGVVLGTAPKVRSGRSNLHFTRRIEAAVALFKAGKVEYLLVSGDNATTFYNEPHAFRDALIDAGIPKDRIACDYAGFRTLDSMVRAGKVFGLEGEGFAVISDDFHVPRAVFLAQRSGFEAVGFSAEPVSTGSSLKSRQREKLARVKAVLDVYVLGTKPKFLGPPEPIGSPPVVLRR